MDQNSKEQNNHLFYSFITLIFTFSGTKGLFALSLLHHSGIKGPYVFLAFALAFFKCPVVNISGQGGLSSPLKVHHHKQRELLMLLYHTLCDTNIRY